METSLLYMHILAGSVALAAGFLALYAEKGRWLHRRFGRIFAYAMLAMTVSACALALTYRPNRVNAVAATVTFYLVITGLLTVIGRGQNLRGAQRALFAIGLAGSAIGWKLGAMAMGQPNHAIDHIPAFAIFMFAVVGTFGVIGDVRLMRAGALHGVPRLRRHLWRMTYAMWVATSSFFLGQARHLPEWFRATHLNAVLVLFVFGTLLYRLTAARNGLSHEPKR